MTKIEFAKILFALTQIYGTTEAMKIFDKLTLNIKN